jgi:hypothetical protein
LTVNSKWALQAERILSQQRPKLEALVQLKGEAEELKVPSYDPHYQGLSKLVRLGEDWTQEYQRLRSTKPLLSSEEVGTLLETIPKGLRILEATHLKDCVSRAEQTQRLIERLLSLQSTPKRREQSGDEPPLKDQLVVPSSVLTSFPSNNAIVQTQPSGCKETQFPSTTIATAAETPLELNPSGCIETQFPSTTDQTQAKVILEESVSTDTKKHTSNKSHKAKTNTKASGFAVQDLYFRPSYDQLMKASKEVEKCVPVPVKNDAELRAVFESLEV